MNVYLIVGGVGLGLLLAVGLALLVVRVRRYLLGSEDAADREDALRRAEKMLNITPNAVGVQITNGKEFYCRTAEEFSRRLLHLSTRNKMVAEAIVLAASQITTEDLAGQEDHDDTEGVEV